MERPSLPALATCAQEGQQGTGWRALPDECWRQTLLLACNQPAATVQQWRQLAQVCKLFYRCVQALPVALDYSRVRHDLRRLPQPQYFYGLDTLGALPAGRLAALLREAPALRQLGSLAATVEADSDLPLIAAACPATLAELELQVINLSADRVAQTLLPLQGLALLPGLRELRLTLDEGVARDVRVDLSALTRLTRLQLGLAKRDRPFTPQLQKLPRSLRHLELCYSRDDPDEVPPHLWAGISLATLPSALQDLRHLSLACLTFNSRSLPAVLPPGLTSVALRTESHLRLQDCAALLQLTGLRQLSCHVHAQTEYEDGGTLHFARRLAGAAQLVADQRLPAACTQGGMGGGAGGPVHRGRRGVLGGGVPS